jgi:hypothetical protein
MPSSRAAAMVLPGTHNSIREKTMEPITITHSELVEDTSDEELVIHAWRAEQLRRLGLSRLLSEAFAALVDWHDVAALIARGCSPELALEIAR